MDFWLDGEAIAEAGSIEAHFREDSLLTDEVVDIIFNRDYEIVDTNGGLIDNYCTFDCWGTCNFKAFKEALESGLDEDVIEAATAIGITLDEAAEKYIGHFDSEEDLAYHEVEQSGMLSDVPECVARYFDYEAYGRDLAIESPNHNGHYFHP
ncbi:hypothetical protein EHW61_16760 [Salinivibrio sp. VYel6]|nr:hypothetical protein [Salinivibrio sp. VYel6]